MDGVATPIIGRPRPLPGHDTPNPAYHPHTLNYEEPHYLALLTYAWNTGDTQPIADMSSPASKFANVYITNISDLYSHGWSYGSSSTVNQILAVQPIDANGADIPENSVLVSFRMTSIDGVKCYGVRTKEDTDEYELTMSLVMTWSNGEWIETQGKVEADHE